MSCSRLSQMLDVQPQAESEGTLNEAEDKLKQMRQDCLKWIALRHLTKMQLFPDVICGLVVVFDDILLEMWLIVGNPTLNFACSGQPLPWWGVSNATHGKTTLQDDESDLSRRREELHPNFSPEIRHEFVP